MKSIELKQATDTLSQYIQTLGKEPLLINIQDTPVAVLTPIADLENLFPETELDSLTLTQQSWPKQSSKGQTSLSDCVFALGTKPAIAEFQGKAIAVLVAIADVETVSLSHNPQFWDIIERSRQQQKAGQSLSSEDVRKKLGLE